jgi:GT2 family glycosyltransferase
VIVTWNCRDLAVECLRSIYESVNVTFEVIVVDNASADGTVDVLAVAFPDVTIIRNERNLGFARGNNLGIQRANGCYLALVNPDVVILDGCIARALETLQNDPSIGVVGPAMLDTQGMVHRSGMRTPGLWNAVCDALVLHHVFGPRPFVGGQMMTDFDWTHRRDVEVLNGWFWLVHRDAVNHVGPLDDRFFMYGEDVDWCERFRRAGWRLVFEPTARAVHHGGGSSRQAPLRFYLELEVANHQYWAKYHRLPKRVAYSAIRAVHHAIRLICYGCVAALAPSNHDVLLKARRHAACLGRMATIFTTAATRARL